MYMLLEEKNILKKQKKNIWESFIVSFLIILFAMLLLRNSEYFIKGAIQIFGYGAVLIGILDILFYFRSSLEQKLLDNRLMRGALLISFGIVSFFEVEILKDMITILLGGYVLFRNATRLQLAVTAKEYTKKLWIYLSGLSLLNIILSLLLIINPWNVKNENQYVSILLIIIESLYFVSNVLVLVGVKSNEKEE